MKIIILLTMIFLHICDDYYLQGILANLKQRSWWRENAPNKMYRHDYIISLFEHAFSWTFMIMLPITLKTLIHKNDLIVGYCIVFVCNILFHAFIDHLKANKHILNLTQDQLFHLVQIVFTWFIFVVL